jgi:hypothetical protein
VTGMIPGEGLGPACSPVAALALASMPRLGLCTRLVCACGHAPSPIAYVCCRSAPPLWLAPPPTPSWCRPFGWCHSCCSSVCLSMPGCGRLSPHGSGIAPESRGGPCRVAGVGVACFGCSCLCRACQCMSCCSTNSSVACSGVWLAGLLILTLLNCPEAVVLSCRPAEVWSSTMGKALADDVGTSQSFRWACPRWILPTVRASVSNQGKVRRTDDGTSTGGRLSHHVLFTSTLSLSEL